MQWVSCFSYNAHIKLLYVLYARLCWHIVPIHPAVCIYSDMTCPRMAIPTLVALLSTEPVRCNSSCWEEFPQHSPGNATFLARDILLTTFSFIHISTICISIWSDQVKRLANTLGLRLIFIHILGKHDLHWPPLSDTGSIDSQRDVQYVCEV